MFLPLHFRRPFGIASVLLIWTLVAVSMARAQKQDESILVKAQRRGMANSEAFTFADSNKGFGVTSAVGSKQATVKSFSFAGKSSVFGGDGVFRTKNFSNPKEGNFRTEAYATRASTVSQRNSFAQSDRAFDTKSVDVREAPGANKTMAVRTYAPAGLTYYGRGKRQDAIDDITASQKNLTIDQVKELLNKGPEGRP